MNFNPRCTACFSCNPPNIKFNISVHTQSLKHYQLFFLLQASKQKIQARCSTTFLCCIIQQSFSLLHNPTIHSSAAQSNNISAECSKNPLPCSILQKSISHYLIFSTSDASTSPPAHLSGGVEDTTLTFKAVNSPRPFPTLLINIAPLTTATLFTVLSALNLQSVNTTAPFAFKIFYTRLQGFSMYFRIKYFYKFMVLLFLIIMTIIRRDDVFKFLLYKHPISVVRFSYE